MNSEHGEGLGNDSEYDLGFAENLVSVAEFVILGGLSDLNAKRTALYLSLLAIEISLKAMLEKAGFAVRDIMRRKHDLDGLLTDLGQCKVLLELGVSGSASRLRAVVVRQDMAEITVGRLLQDCSGPASKYPNQIRYGRLLRHYPPDVVANAAREVLSFALRYWETLKI